MHIISFFTHRASNGGMFVMQRDICRYVTYCVWKHNLYWVFEFELYVNGYDQGFKSELLTWLTYRTLKYISVRWCQKDKRSSFNIKHQIKCWEWTPVFYILGRHASTQMCSMCWSQNFLEEVLKEIFERRLSCMENDLIMFRICSFWIKMKPVFVPTGKTTWKVAVVNSTRVSSSRICPKPFSRKKKC